eukprot:TRINITY_DN2341_c1_g2_i1.p1 TRINITY_DN2341_c1_g2~~TRINITY_DN2341_c1_g2_i1.p1  ORF type:complete len:286 (-),score=104.35 TRINITY_DN2341_c1_g2_i1:145-1002(-)
MVFSFISKIIRLIAVLCWLAVTIPFLWSICWIRPFHAILRKLGCPIHLLPLDIAQRYVSTGMLYVASIKVESFDTQNVPLYEPVVFVMTHSSNLDGFAILGHCPVTPKFIFKKEMLYTVPPMAWLMWILGHIPIDRSNRESALKSLKNAGKKIKIYSRSIAIFPEGRRSPNGELLPFKKGGFHLAKEAEIKIIPTLISGGNELWPPKSFFSKAGTISVRYLPAIENDGSDTVDELLEKVRNKIIEGQKKYTTNKSSVSKHSFLIDIMPGTIFLVTLFSTIKYFFF